MSSSGFHTIEIFGWELMIQINSDTPDEFHLREAKLFEKEFPLDDDSRAILEESIASHPNFRRWQASAWEDSQ